MVTVSSTSHASHNVCYAFQAGNCSKGDECKFSHDLQELENLPEKVIELQSPRLYVNNLSYEVSWQDLKDLFRQVRWWNSSGGGDVSDDDILMMMMCMMHYV